MPLSPSFKQRLYPHLPQIVAHFGSPFHIYDEAGIRGTCRSLCEAFERVGEFREYFAVKALPNPRVLGVVREMGLGFDCSSLPELALARGAGARGEAIMFTSNNSTREELQAALALGAILNLDDVGHLAHLPHMPELICFRYNPGPRRTPPPISTPQSPISNAHWSIIGAPAEAKFGVAHHQLLDAYRMARERGARRFGLHTMLVSNERDYRALLQTVQMLLDVALWLYEELQIELEFINMGGGLGIPYHPEDTPLALPALVAGIGELFDAFQRNAGYRPRLYMESGRYVTGPHGALVTRVINRKETYRTFIGVDAGMPALMRPAMYGAYHHIERLEPDAAQGPGDGSPTREGSPTGEQEVVDVVGSLCENNDKFAIQRSLPRIEVGDILIIHDTGAHGHAMGFTYNGRLRPQELLLTSGGTVERIRRAETEEDYFATLGFEPEVLVV